MRNQWAGYPVSDDWADHVKRGSSGGIDYMVPSGTPIYMPVDGRVTSIPNNGTGGHTVRIYPEQGISDLAFIEFMHLSTLPPSGVYKTGELIGATGGDKGAPGAGSSTGAHVHAHAYNTMWKRVPYEQYCTEESQPSIDTIRNIIKEQGMRVLTAPRGAIALVGENYAYVYPAATPGNNFSIDANKAAYGESVVTPDQLSTLVAEARVRREQLITELRK